jgi:hypothetical protein
MQDFDKIIESKQSLFFSFPDFNKLIAKIDILLPEVDKIYDIISKSMPTPFENDVRLSTISRIELLCNYCKLSFTFLNEQLLPLNNAWWEQNYKLQIQDDFFKERSVLTNGFSSGFVKFAALQHLFANIENAFRIFLRKIDPSACNNGMDDFENIYRALKKRTSSFPGYSDDFLKLLRLSRNTIHNNSAYFHKKGNEQVIYKNVLYNFNFGKPINFVTWDWLIERIEDVLNFLNIIIFDPKIINEPTEIEDSFLANR